MTRSMKKVLFLCGSPKGEASSSLLVARYLASFLEHPFTFVDVCTAKLSPDASESERGFLDVVRQIREASCVVWVFGAVIWHAPVQLKCLFDKCFEQDLRFDGKIAATVLSGAHLLDEFILENMRLISEQLGFGYLGDVSAEGVPGGYADERRTEDACRVLAGTIDAALEAGHVPYRQTASLPVDDLKPLHFAKGFAVSGQESPKTGDKNIVVVTGHKLERNPAAKAIHDAIRRYSVNTVRLIEVEGSGIEACQLQQECMFRKDLICPIQDAFPDMRRVLLDADGVILIGQCAATCVDAPLLTLIGRVGSLLIMPQLKGKYGFAVATGGGRLGRNTARYLSNILTACGVQSLGALTDGESGGQGLDEEVRWMVMQLDKAMDEQWTAPDRFLVRTEHYFQREMAAKYGAVVPGYYHYFAGNRLFDFPPLVVTRLLALVIRGRWLPDFLIRQAAKATRAKWEKRLRRDLARLRPAAAAVRTSPQS